MLKIILKNKVKILVSFLIFIILFGIYLLNSPHPVPTESGPAPLHLDKMERGSGGETTLEIEGIKYESKIDDSMSVYEFMQKLEKENKIYFKDKDYGEMGKLIEEINGVKNSGGKNWIYYINGKKAEIGVSNYKMKPGDKITWKYENYY